MSSFVASTVKAAMLSVFGFVVGGLAVVFVREPFSFDLVPKILQTWSHGQKIELLLPDGKGNVESAGAYSIYAFSLGTGADFGGRLVIRSDDGKDTDEQSYLSGFQRDDIMAFNYWPVVTKNTGGGDFIGKRRGDAYLGSLVGFDKTGNETECVLRRFIAVVADDRQKDIQVLAKEGLPSFVEWSPPDSTKQMKFSCPPAKPPLQRAARKQPKP